LQWRSLIHHRHRSLAQSHSAVKNAANGGKDDGGDGKGKGDFNQGESTRVAP
jgi:hypothetical protein